MDNPEKNKNLTGAIEAILFVYGEPMEIKKLAKLLKTSEAAAKEAIKGLEQQLAAENRGLKLISKDSPAGISVQLATKPEFAPLLENFIKEEFKENLTPASLETLSLIAYMGPISRAQIDYYRGVNSAFILRSLLIRGLIERRLDPKKTNVYLYELSFDLLKYLGISKVEDLPEYEEFKTMSDEPSTS
jgi:segregation and condensation protein B